ncbi:sushi, von Willebrand factor type A, EGF and pentraxin domain-containing protein 1-like isoform X2 [Ornithodoros turicata]|uniref:sushi, von Willebrand factor type A, EGF and pentraxin domain-containing protein 1-like isoform X2 n=1 Tax=Ornithodoros turicata TaxID=34597 RepID=UPI0031391A02
MNLATLVWSVLLTLQWDAALCATIPACPDIPEVGNATYEELERHDASPYMRVRYICNEGYYLEGSHEIACVDAEQGRQWHPEPPACHGFKNCEDIGDIPNGFVTGDEACCKPGDKLGFVCDNDVTHQLVGTSELTCLNNGSWDHPAPQCLAKAVEVCEDLVVPNSVVRADKSGGDYFVPDDEALVHCNHGYRLNGTDFLVCNEDGTWSDPVPSCVEYNCTRVDFGPHIIVEEFVNSNVTEFPVDSRVYPKCEEGYMLKGASSLICTGGGWSGKPKCRRIHCGRPSVPEFGWMKIDTSFIGDVASFGCQEGYKLIGHENRFCLNNGVWSGCVARCVLEEGLVAQRGCESPGIPDNGVKSGRSYRPGANVTFACNPGYSLRGQDTISCDHRGFWSHPLPTCIGKFYYDMPSNVEERLMKPLRIIQNMSDTLNTPVESRARVLNLNVSGVRHVAYFVIDASTSMGERDFWKGVALTRAIIMKINVTQRGHRVGVVTFSNSATSVAKPHVDVSMDMVLEKLRNISYTKGGTDLKAALAQVEKDFHTARRKILQSHEKLHISIFLITDGKANLGGSPKQVLAKLKRKPHQAEVYAIGVTSTPNREALEGLVSSPVDDHLFILRDYDSIVWLAEKLTNGTIDYSVCGSTQRHNIDTGKEDGPQARIAGGEDVETPWPWMVKLNRSGALCGASIISRTWILTAAHCVSNGGRYEIVRPEEIQIQLGLTDTRNTSSVKNIPVKSIIRHEDYNGTTFENDIALLELQSNMTYDAYIRPICLPPGKLRSSSHFYPAKKHAFAIGWGKSGTWNTMQKLQQVKITIHDDATCTSAHKNHTYTDNMMCAGGYGEGDSCKGDSGGPLMQGVTKDEYIWTQVGIVSWGQGEGCKKSGKPGVYTRLSRYRPWIDQYVPDAQESP